MDKDLRKHRVYADEAEYNLNTTHSGWALQEENVTLIATLSDAGVLLCHEIHICNNATKFP